MEMQIKVTHTLAPEALELLKGLLGGKAIKSSAPAAKEPAAPAASSSAVSSTELSFETVRAKAVELSQKGKRNEVKALNAKHGGEKVTDLKKEVYQVYYNDLLALEKGASSADLGI